MTNKESTEKSVRRLEMLVNHLLDKNASYHNHKETMAHAGLLLEVALLGFIISSEQWPPCWIPNNLLIPFGIVIILICILIHVFVRWQLRHRRFASTKYAAILKTSNKLIYNDLEDDDILYSKKEIKKSYCSFQNLLDYFFPMKIFLLPDDIKKYQFPNIIEKEIIEEAKFDSNAFISEKIICFGSFIVFVIIIYRTLTF